jgi:single-stranded-DNA-specific exonuclease
MNYPESLRPSRWIVEPVVSKSLQQEMTHIHPILLQVLYNRGLSDAGQIKAFLGGHYPYSDDPFLLPDMDAAITRIGQAIENEETIAVYGDFDADGVTSTVLMVQALREMGLRRDQVLPYIPDRVDEGYGLNNAALLGLRKKGVDLVITVDCGTRAVEEAETAGKIGLDMVITDHHSIGSTLPPAVAVVNPSRPDSTYPEKHLAGVGTAFKVAQALKVSFPTRARFENEELLDLVALGTVADIVRLQGENRKLVREGLGVINAFRRPGIKALANSSGVKAGAIGAESIAFALAPRLNAAGRLAHAYDAARLLAVNNERMAGEYAERLNELNRKRQRLTERFSIEAEAQIKPEGPLLFAADPSFAPGVVGLVAGRLADKYYRPAIVVEQGKDESRGSCRSIPEFHITRALDMLQSLLVRHGGHAQAAGFTINSEHLAQFHEELTAIAADELGDKELERVLHIDAEIEVGDVDWALQEVLTRLEPTGEANPRPILMIKNVHVFGHRAVGRDNSHLQLWVGNSRTKLDCIAFRQGAWAGYLPERIDIAFALGVNYWNGKTKLQLTVEDIRPAQK